MFIEKLFALIIGLLFLFVLACDGPSGSAEHKTVTLTSQRTLKSSPAFWDYAASSNMLQVEIGQLAIERGDESVKVMAEKAVGFHSQALKQLKAIARKHMGIQLPDSLSGADSNLIKEFELLEGEKFNARYKAFISNSHQLQLSRYQEALQKADDQETREWLDALVRHLHEELGDLDKAEADSLHRETLL